MQKIIEKIKSIIQDISGISTEDIETDCNLFSLGLDSLMLVQIKKRIDREFDMELPLARVMSDLDTIEKIAYFMEHDNQENDNWMDTAGEKIQTGQENAITDNLEKFEDVQPSNRILMEKAVEPEVAVEWKTLTNVQEPVTQYEKKKEVPKKLVQKEKGGSELQEILEMQMRVMAESLQGLAAKQLEIVVQNTGKKESLPEEVKPVVRKAVAREATSNKEHPQINFRAVKIDRDIFNDKQKQFIHDFIVRYNQKTRRSKDYARKNRRQFCDWIASLNFRMDFKELIYPIVSARSQGAKFWDLDGNQYLDMAIGYGVHYFGHRPQFIIDALQQQMAEGYETGPQTDLGGEVSSLLCKITGAERVAFTNTGSEAVMAAMRIARTVNKKSKIVMFRGSYHGNFDCVLAESIDGMTFPTSPGTMDGMVEDVIVLEYGKEESLEIIREQAAMIAGVMVEPVQSRNPGLQPREFLHKLRALTHQIQAALIFDEMITGFRICPGGCQEYFDVTADIVTYGKIVGGGLPIGIVAGKADYLDAIDGGEWNYGDDSYPEKEMTFFAGTFCKHPLSLAAAHAVLRFIDQNEGEVQKKVNRLTENFVMQVNAYFAEENVPMHVTYFGSLFRFEAYGKYELSKLPAEIELFFYLLMEKGVYIWEKRTCFFSAAHTADDARFFFDAIKKSVREMREGGFSFCSREGVTLDKKAGAREQTKLETGIEAELEIKKKTTIGNSRREEDVTYCKATKAQERYFLLSQMDKSQEGTHLTSALLLTGEFAIGRVEGIFQKIVDSQEALRACYTVWESELYLKIQKKCKIQVEQAEGEEAQIDRYIKEFICPFDLFQPPLMRVKIVKLSYRKYLLLFDLYHGIADGYSCTLITKQFMDLYEGKKIEYKGRTCEEYIQAQERFQASKEYQLSIDYWKETLSKEDMGIVYPLDFPRGQKQEWEGNVVRQTIDHQNLIGLLKLTKDMKCSLFHVLYGAFALLLHKASGKNPFVIGTPMVNRGEDFIETVGYFTNTVVIKNVLDQSWSLEKYLEETKKSCANSFANGKISFSEIVSHVPIRQFANRNQVFDTMFIYENGEERVNHIANLACEGVEIPITLSFFDLSFEIVEEHKQLAICVTYKTSLYKEDTIREMIVYYKQILKEMIHHPEEKVSYYLREKEKKWKHINQPLEEKAMVCLKENRIDAPFSIQTKSALEEELLQYWKEILHLDYVDVHSNFFDLGGRSIDAMQLIEKLKGKYKVSIMDIFQYPSVEQLAMKISGTLFKKAEQPKQSLPDKISLKKQRLEGQMPVAIIGMAGRFPKSSNLSEFWENIVEKKECIQFLDKEDLLKEGISEEELENKDYVNAKGVLEGAECFDAAFFEYSPKEAEKMDPQIRIFHECAWNALEDAGYTPGSIAAGGAQPQKIGVFAGSASNYTWMSQIYQPTSVTQERIERISLNDKDYMTTRISYKMNLTGPSYGIQTACSSSLTSIHVACRALEQGECEMALAGGVSVMLPKKTGYVYEDGMIFSKDGHCRVFDKDATGTVFSDGVGVIVLKPLEKALEDKDVIYAVIKGTATNNDGNRKAGYTAPSIIGQAEVIQDALKNANVDPSTITYIEAHGTGTRIGDPIEVEGLKKVYPKKENPYCALSSLKANFGHLDAAAGVAGVMKVALALKYHKIPGTICCDNPNPNMNIEDSPFYIPYHTTEWIRKIAEDGTELPRRAGVTSLGFGGTNAHVVLEEIATEGLDNQDDQISRNMPKLFLFSAKTSNALERMREQYKQFLADNPMVNLNHLAYTLQVGRKAFAYREMILASDKEGLLKGLQGKKKRVVTKTDTAEREKVKLVFLFSGQGSQYVNMTKELYDKEQVFREKLDTCFAITKDVLHCKTDYKSVLFPEEPESETGRIQINETENAQVIIFMIEYAMASYLITLGIVPEALLGHSLGEYAAACIAGVFSLEDGLRLVIGRARLMQKMQRGGMDVLNTSEADTSTLITDSHRTLWLAAQNGMQNSVVSGSFEELEAFEAYLDKREIEYKRLETSHAFHSGMMDDMMEPFGELVKTVPMLFPNIPYISNLTGNWVNEEILSPAYWCNHLRHTVRFYDGVKTLLQKKCIFVEVGPGNVLSTLVRQCTVLGNVKSVYNMIRHPKEDVNDIEYFMEKIGELWCSGINVDFRAQYGSFPLHKISLPGYPFKGQEFPMRKLISGNGQNKKPAFEWLYRPCWKLRKQKEHVEVIDSVLLLASQNHIAQCFYKKLKDYGVPCNVIMLNDAWENKLQEFVAGYVEMDSGICILNTIPYSEPTMENCFWEIIRQIQILGSSKNVHYYVITKEVSHRKSMVTSLLSGICGVANKEYDNLSCTHLEVDKEEEEEQLAELVLTECSCKQNTSFVKFQNGVPLEQDEEPIEIEETEDCVFCKYGNYIITGGMGDIGRYIATYLSEKYQANVLLLAKNPLPEEELWERYVKEQPYDYVSQKIKSMLHWRQTGAHIKVEVCDICNYAILEKKVCTFENAYGRVQGVFHTAGLKGEGLIRFKNKENSLEVLRPKVQGTQTLDKVFAGRELDFMMLFSSLATVTKDVGQADYVAANQYLDAYAEWAAERYPDRKTISVHWDNWKEIGMAHRAGIEKPSRRRLFESALLPAQGMKLIEKILRGAESQVIISVEDLRKRKQKQNGNENTQEELVKSILQGAAIYERPELSSEYEEPVTELQKHIAKVWACAFSLNTVGIQDDFFELGGDSLYAIGIVNELKKYYQIDMTDIYDYPTVLQLAKKLQTHSADLEQQLNAVKKSLDIITDISAREQELKGERERYSQLCLPYQNLILSEKKKWKQILLLGGTGYLGIYLLREIVTQTDAQVVLIVRPTEECDGQSRIYEKFCAYFGEELYQVYQDRWLVLDGKITEQNFGLDYSVYWELARSTECIVNASGKVDHYGEYEAFYEANVEIVKQVIAFAKTGCKKEIHEMSTKGVGTGKIEGRNCILFTEFDTDFGQEFNNYYVETKHEAERMLLGLRADGFDVNLYRIGDIVYDSENGHFQENIEKNAVYLLMQSILELDYLPNFPFAYMEFSYVDFIGKAVVSLMQQKELKQETYHLLNPYLISIKDLGVVLEKEGFQTSQIEADDFIQYLIEHYDDEKKKGTIQNFLTYSHLLDIPMYTEFVIATEKTCCILRKLGLNWNKPDVNSIRKMIEYGQKIHFFVNPSEKE